MDRKCVFWTGLLFRAPLPQFVQSVRAGGGEEAGLCEGRGAELSQKSVCVSMASFALVLGMTLISQSISENCFIRCGKT